MPKESTDAKKAFNSPLTDFDQFKAREVMGDRPIMSFDEFAAAYYKNTSAKEVGVSTDEIKDPRVETVRRRDGIRKDTPMDRDKTTKENHLDLKAAEQVENPRVDREKRRNRSGTATPVEEGKRVEENGVAMASERDKKTSHNGCLFLDLLPAEIRNLIYSYVLTSPVPIRNAGELVEQMAVGLIVADGKHHSQFILFSRFLCTANTGTVVFEFRLAATLH